LSISIAALPSSVFTGACQCLAARQILKEVDAMGRKSKHSALLTGKALLRKAD